MHSALVPKSTDDWMEEILSCSIWEAAAWREDDRGDGVLEYRDSGSVISLAVSVEKDSETTIPHSEEAARRNHDLTLIKTYLSTLIAPRNLSEKQVKQFIK